MKRPFTRVAGATALAIATAAFAGTALAGNGNGNSANAPGQLKQSDTAQPVAVQPQAAQPESSQAQPAGDAATHVAPGQAKQESSPGSSASSSATQATQPASPGQQKQADRQSGAGVKPSSTTTHWTACVTGGTAASATCTAKAGTPNTKADVSKQYGNGKTAAQIAVSRGGVGVTLSGPGNSQPHKVSICGKPSNKSGGVDVHAVKSYDTSSCQATTQKPSVETSVMSTCGTTVVVSTSAGVVGVLHGKHDHLMTNPSSAHFTKHDDERVVGTSSSTQVVPTAQICGATTQGGSVQSSDSETSSAAPSTQASAVLGAQAPVAASQPSVSSATAAPATSAPATSAPATSAPATSAPAASAPAASATGTPATGGVLGAQASLGGPKKSTGGVLGTVGTVAGSSLPFTGFPVWVALLTGLALVATGLVVRRHGTGGARV